jgi:hypothetical protein
MDTVRYEGIGMYIVFAVAATLCVVNEGGRSNDHCHAFWRRWQF